MNATLRFTSLLFAVCVLAAPVQAQEVDAATAQRALRTGDYDRARTDYELLLERAGDMAFALGYFETFLQTGRYQEGLSTVETLLLEHANDPHLMHMKGKLLVEVGRLAEAEAAFGIANRKPDFWANTLALAQLLEQTGRKREARNLFIRLYRPFMQGQFTTADDIGRAAYATARLAEFREANEAFRTANRIDGQHVQNLYWWADLFREKYNTADAQRTFEDALRVNEHWADLYVGYAHTFNSFAKQEELAQRALALNPNHVGAMNIVAGLRILDAAYEEAAQVAEAALAINPASIEALAHLASVHHLRDDTTAFAEVEARALAINPRAGQFYLTLSKNTEYRFRYPASATFAAQATQVEGDNWTAYATLGIALLRVGRFQEARRYLEGSFERDPFNLFVGNTLTLLDAFEDFEMLESTHFRLLIHKEESAVLGPAMLDLAEKTYADMQPRYGYTPPDKILIEAYNDHDDFAVRVGGIPHLGLLGVSFGDIVAMDTPRAQQGDDYNWARTLWHELGHTMAIGASQHRVPRWFTEGLSVYEERRARPEWGRELDLELFEALDQGFLLPIAEMDQGFTRPRFPGQILLSYYHASKVIGYIADQYGFEAIAQTLRGLAAGKDIVTSLDEAVPVTFAELQAGFDAALQAERDAVGDLMEGMPTMLVPEEEPSLVERITGPSENALIRRLQAGNEHLRNRRFSQAEVEFNAALDLYPDFVMPGNAYLGLAAIYREQNDEAKLMNVLERYLAISEFGAAESRELGDLFAPQGDLDRAIASYERVLFVAPYDLPTQEQLADWYEAQGRWPEAIRARRAVVGLNPVDGATARFALARALYRNNQLAEAKRSVLESLEIAPGYRDAQKLLLTMVEAQE